MEKQFNLIIDTKRRIFNTVRGLKQGENNSVLNINIVQNSIPFNLTDCTVRLNYKISSGQILLQMADVVNAIEGKVKINILTRVLAMAGEIKADLSIFNKANEKITSTSFSLFIDTSIYTNDYITKNDEFDIIQRVWTSEDERIKAEKERKENETNRKNAENIRVENEENRKSEETKRGNSEKIREDNEIEREQNEANRIENEKIRAESESKRIKDEESRSTEESKRVESEEERKANESARRQGYANIQNTIDNFGVCEEYNCEKKYKKYNRTTFNGSSYECLKDSKGIDPTNLEYWICIAEKGKDGLGTGNMHTDTYDTNNNGIVDKAESITDGSITYTVTDIKAQLDKFIKDIEDIDLSADRVTLDSSDFKSKNVKGALEELFTCGNNVKSNTVDTLLQLDKSLQINKNSNWNDIIKNISKISTGKKYASGTITLNKPSDSNWANVRQRDLNFEPSFVIYELVNGYNYCGFISRNGLGTTECHGLYIDMGNQASQLKKDSYSSSKSDYIYSDGFKVSIYLNKNHTFRWYAYE